MLFWGLCYLVLTGCEHNTGNFSQYHGFAEYFMNNPPSQDLPGPDDQQLVRRFQPRLMMAEGQQKPIDFYRDYISSGVLSNGHGEVISSEVNRELINTHKNNPEVIFKHIPGKESGGAVVYGRIDRETVSFDTDSGKLLKPLTFLTYHAVFRNSGIPAGIPTWQEFALSLVFNLDDWHQLDHYTAVSLVIDENKQSGVKPVAIMLQQHNNLRTFLLGEEVTIPDDGRVVIDIAKRSNELFPHTPGFARHRAVDMPDPEGMRFLLTGENKSRFAGYDITDGTTEVEYTLEFLPPDDAFYTFKGFLGERRVMKGRDAPPGAAYNTLPELKPLSIQLFTGYWRDNDEGDIARLGKTILKNSDYIGFAMLQKAEFYRNWKVIQQGK
jgi:hypothetical protein